MATKKTKALSFEEGLERLEVIAAQMERGDQPLDALLKLYEEGMQLSKTLGQKLDEINGRMQEVKADAAGKPVVNPSAVIHQETLLDALDE